MFFFGDFCFCFCLLVREKNINYRERVLFLVTQHTPRAYYYYDPGFQPERRPSDGESDHVDVRFLRLLCLLLLLLLARRLTSCFFFFSFRDMGRMRVFSGVTHSLSLSLSLALRYATTTTTTTLTTQGRPRDVRETRVPVPERKDERSRATKSGLRDDVSSRRMHVRVDSFLVSLASPTFSLAFFFSLSRARGARYTLLHVYERWCAYACAVCTNARASPHFTCHAGLSRRSNLPGRTKNFPRRNLG